MIYNIGGDVVASAFNIDGNLLSNVYDKDGNTVLTGGLKIMQYNVGSWYDGNHDNVPSAKDTEYYNLQNGMIQADDPDILCLEEYTKEFSKTGRTAKSILEQYFPYIHEQGGDSATVTTGRCIASKYPISNYTTHQYSTSGSPRYYDSCTITVGDIPITVVVTHLNYDASSNTSRVEQLNELITFLQGQTRFICCGDFNMIDCKSTSGADYVAMMIPLLNAGFHCANCSDNGFLITYSDEPTGTWTGCLDNIVTSSNITITDAYVDETKLNDSISDRTDHMPLIAELRI